MVEKIIEEVFPNFEKWNAFLELEHYKGKLFEYWRSKYQTILKERFIIEFQEWSIEFHDSFNVYFFPKGYQSRKSIEIWIENGFQLSFWVDLSHFDLSKVKYLIEENINIIETCIKQTISIIKTEDSYIFKTQIIYNLPFDVNSNFDKLRYFGDKELPGEIIETVKPLITNPIIFQLFNDINMQCIK